MYGSVVQEIIARLLGMVLVVTRLSMMMIGWFVVVVW